MSALVATMQLEQALALVAGVKTVDVAKELVEQATALEAYARRRAAATELHADAYVILQSANRRLGQLCRELPQAPAGRKAQSEIDNTVLPISKGEALAAINLSRMQASRLEKLADIADADWDARLASLRDKVTKQAGPNSMTAHSAAGDYDGDESYTPADWLAAGRVALGGEFDLDPASCEAAQANVRAKKYFTKEQNGLTHFWRCKRLWLNPPYSRIGAEFVAKFILEYQKKRMASGLLLVNNDTDTAWCQSVLDRFAVCFTEGRISFIQNGKPATNNRQGQAIFYAGKNRERFKAAFSKFGKVLVPA